MPLKLGPISQQVERMTAQATARDRRRWLEEARRLLLTLDPSQLRARLKERRERIPWLVATPVGSLSARFPAPKPPADFTVVAADGSSIPPERHSPLRFYVINTGYVALTYGHRPNALLDSGGRLYFEEEDLYLLPGQEMSRVEGARLGLKMEIAEMEALWQASTLADLPLVAIRDGSLILWPVQGEAKEVQEKLLGEFLEPLERFRQAGWPVISYISKTDAHDVVNALRVWVCEGDLDCYHCNCRAEAKVLSLALMSVWDREIFTHLGNGERSDVFDSASDVLSHYGSHRIQFFYINVGGEIVRIEAPQWVMRNQAMLNLAHGLVYDQCRRSGAYLPYPPALQEAHEQAVISTGERRLMEELVDRALAQQGVVSLRSAKDTSKRRRAV